MRQSTSQSLYPTLGNQIDTRRSATLRALWPIRGATRIHRLPNRAATSSGLAQPAQEDRGRRQRTSPVGPSNSDTNNHSFHRGPGGTRLVTPGDS